MNDLFVIVTGKLHHANWKNRFPNTGLSFHQAQRIKKRLVKQQTTCYTCHNEFLIGEKLKVLYENKSREFIAIIHKKCPE